MPYLYIKLFFSLPKKEKMRMIIVFISFWCFMWLMRTLTLHMLDIPASTATLGQLLSIVFYFLFTLACIIPGRTEESFIEKVISRTSPGKLLLTAALVSFFLYIQPIQYLFTNLSISLTWLKESVLYYLHVFTSDKQYHPNMNNADLNPVDHDLITKSTGSVDHDLITKFTVPVDEPLNLIQLCLNRAGSYLSDLGENFMKNFDKNSTYKKVGVPVDFNTTMFKPAHATGTRFVMLKPVQTINTQSPIIKELFAYYRNEWQKPFLSDREIADILKSKAKNIDSLNNGVTLSYHGSSFINLDSLVKAIKLPFFNCLDLGIEAENWSKTTKYLSSKYLDVTHLKSKELPVSAIDIQLVKSSHKLDHDIIYPTSSTYLDNIVAEHVRQSSTLTVYPVQFQAFPVRFQPYSMERFVYPLDPDVFDPWKCTYNEHSFTSPNDPNLNRNLRRQIHDFNTCNELLGTLDARLPELRPWLEHNRSNPHNILNIYDAPGNHLMSDDTLIILHRLLNKYFLFKIDLVMSNDFVGMYWYEGAAKEGARHKIRAEDFLAINEFVYRTCFERVRETIRPGLHVLSGKEYSRARIKGLTQDVMTTYPNRYSKPRRWGSAAVYVSNIAELFALILNDLRFMGEKDILIEDLVISGDTELVFDNDLRILASKIYKNSIPSQFPYHRLKAFQWHLMKFLVSDPKDLVENRLNNWLQLPTEEEVASRYNM